MSEIFSKKPFPFIPFKLKDVVISLGGFFFATVLAIILYIIRLQFKGIESISGWLGISHPTLNILLEYLASGFILLIIWFFVLRKYRLDWNGFGFFPVKLWTLFSWVVLGFIITLIAWIVVTPLIVIFLPQIDLSESQDILVTGYTTTARVLVIIYAVLIGPFIEEIVFRGIVLPGLANRFNLIIGIVISTVIWSLLHFQINIIIFTSIFGVVLGYMYYRTQSLWPSYITHVLKNLLAVIAVYLLGIS